MAETTNNAPDLKVRYSDEELQEFKAIILEMLEKAKEEYKTLRDVVTHASSNDVEEPRTSSWAVRSCTSTRSPSRARCRWAMSP